MNIVLIGFMGSGKTTVGKILAEISNMSFIDTDAIIETNSNRSIKQIFEEFGEEYFRSLEKKAIEGLSDIKNSVVSVGGGAVMYHSNFDVLRKIGYTVFLNTPLQQIYTNLGGAFRPLIGNNINREETERLYYSRLDTYLKADLVIDTANKDTKDIAIIIKNKIDKLFIMENL